MIKNALILLFVSGMFSLFGQVSNLNDGLEDLTSQIIEEMGIQKKSKIAIIEFSDLEGNKIKMGKYIAEELTTRLFKTKKFDVVERSMLEKILKEQQLSLTGLLDEESAKQLGKILGVDAICSGTITDLSNTIKINARLISTETGSLFSVASIEVKKDPSVNKLMVIVEENKVSGIKTEDKLDVVKQESEKKQGSTDLNNSFSNADLKRGVVAYYPFNGNASDASGNNYHGTVIGAPLTTDRFGMNNSAYYFDGQNAYIDLGTYFNFQEFSISFWVYNYAINPNYTVIIDNNHTDYRSWVLQAAPNTSVYGYGASRTAPAIMVDVPLNQWKHIVLVRTSTKSILYADNLLIGNENCTQPINYDGSQRLSLGKYSWGGRYFCGKIDDVYIFNRALDEQEISALFKAKK